MDIQKLAAVLALFLCLLFTPLVSSAGIEIKLDKDKFFQEELLQAEILGTFTDSLEESNMAVYKDNQVHSTPVESGLLKLENKYIYYAVLPSAVGNYSLQIRDAEFYIGQDVASDTIAKNFTVSSTTNPYLSVSPGFLSVTRDFSVRVKSMNAVQEVAAKFKATGESIEKEIGYNAEKTFSFSIAGLEEYAESEVEISTDGFLSGKNHKIFVFVYPPSESEAPFVPEVIIPEEKPALNKTETPEAVPYEEATPSQRQSCEDLDAFLCKEGEICDGPTDIAKGVICCKGTCKKQESSLAWISGLVLFIILIGAAAWLYMKSKKSSPKLGSSKNSIEEQAAKYKQRAGIYHNLKPEVEVKKGLSRV